MTNTSTNTPKRKYYCVVYRSGGTANFKWRRTIAWETKERAETECAVVQRMGYKAFIEDYHMSLNIGLPETFDLSK